MVCGLVSDTQIDLCSYCKPQLPWRCNSCYHCGATLQQATEAIICAKCQDCLPAFNRVCALFNYAPPLPQLIATLKFGKQLYPAQVFGLLLVEKLRQQWYLKEALPQAIIPVPLSNKRLLQRGYNQALEICRPLSSSLNIPIEIAICKKITDTKPQSKLQRAQRVRNLSSAFIVNNSSQYTHVALVDDVMTTGSTVRAISSLLVAAGVEFVDVWCVARV